MPCEKSQDVRDGISFNSSDVVYSPCKFARVVAPARKRANVYAFHLSVSFSVSISLSLSLPQDFTCTRHRMCLHISEWNLPSRLSAEFHFPTHPPSPKSSPCLLRSRIRTSSPRDSAARSWGRCYVTICRLTVAIHRDPVRTNSRPRSSR